MICQLRVEEGRGREGREERRKICVQAVEVASFEGNSRPICCYLRSWYIATRRGTACGHSRVLGTVWT